jgi:hypothetical protein
MKIICCILAVGFLLPVESSFAQKKSLADLFVGGAAKAANPGAPASHRAAVEELFNQLDMPATVNQTVMQIAATLTGAAAEDGAYKDAVDAYVRKYVGWEALKDELIAMYMKTFTEKEIMELIAFYNTSTGRKLLVQSPEIGAAISVSVHNRLVEHSPELKQMMMETDFKVFKDALGQDYSEPADKP